MLTPDEGSPVKSLANICLAQLHAEHLEQQRMDNECWLYCCRLSEKEKLYAENAWQKLEDERVAGLHFSFVLRKQAVNGGRWNELSRLRAREIFENKIGLVRNFQSWMRALDRRLMSCGIFIGSYTRKHLVHPVYGEMPQLAPEVDMTGDSSSCSSL